MAKAARSNSKRRSTPKQGTLKVPKVPPGPAIDPIFAAIAKHRAALGDFRTALDIPEMPQTKALRDKEEKRTRSLEHNALWDLAETPPGTLNGVVAALDYFVDPAGDIVGGLDEIEATYLTTIFNRLIELVGPVPGGR